LATQRTATGPAVARKAREQFVAALSALLGPLGNQIRNRFLELAQTPAGAREMQERRDAMMDFDKKGNAFVQGTAKAWQKAIDPPTATAMVRMEALNLQLVDEDVVERKIMSSRIALVVSEKAVWDLNDIKVRIQHLEGEDQATTDILRPEAMCLSLVEQWGAAGLSREAWNLVQDIIQKAMLESVPKAYAQVNEFLVANNVMRDIDFSARVRRGANSPAQPRPAQAGGDQPAPDTGGGPQGSTSSGGDWGSSGPASGSGASGSGGSYGYADNAPGGPAGAMAGGAGGGGYSGGGYAQGAPGDAASARANGRASGAQPGGGAQPGSGGASGGAFGGQAAHGNGAAGGMPAPGSNRAGPGDSGAGNRSFGGAHQAGASGGATQHGISDETRMMTSSPPLARARARASGVIGQLKRLLTERVEGYDAAPATRPSPALAEALAYQSSQVHDTVAEGMISAEGGAGVSDGIMVFDDAAVQRVAVDLRQRTGELKKKAGTESEKATIEIVALMFQAILAEERIPAAIRVWFARLQMPVLRVAIAEPEFFGSLDHPARQLIDRMGSVVMGFDAAAINGSALETEIKRVVQVIEQYPETGRRVFQLVYEEFQKFLSKFLTEEQSRQKVVSVAQQVEQKETMAIQYTIEMRRLLAELPVREEIRDFLFKVWTEVLALAAVRNGPRHVETVAFKQAASDLVWAASAKPNRAERSKVIQDLPKLLSRLRQGMTLVGITGADQEARIKTIGDIFADAFMSKTEAIPQDRIDAMARRLEHLEDFVATESGEADLPLDRESIEMMLGIDASMIEVIADGGSRPSAGMVSWANELQLGNWFTLDHNGSTTQVQYVWRSERRQLHLFAARGGRSYLVQAKRLAAYLQAGLLLPAEEETLTVRATRDALAKLDANPERLFQ
jgi:hypothetical protein